MVKKRLQGFPEQLHTTTGLLQHCSNRLQDLQERFQTVTGFPRTVGNGYSVSQNGWKLVRQLLNNGYETDKMRWRVITVKDY